MALLLVLGAVLVALLAPGVLNGRRWQIFWPRLALGAWMGLLVAAVGLLLAAGIVGVVRATVSARNGWGIAEFAGSWLAVGVLAGVIALVTGASEPLVTSYRRSLELVAPVAHAREDRGSFVLVRFRSDEPVAISAPGRAPEILVSSALEDLLTTAQLQAVLAHELAHLRGHHGLLVRLSEIGAACLPRWVPLGGQLCRAARLLVELVADDHAARQAGTEQLALALDQLALVGADPGLAVRAERLRGLPQARRAPIGLPAAVRLPAGGS